MPRLCFTLNSQLTRAMQIFGNTENRSSSVAGCSLNIARDCGVSYSAPLMDLGRLCKELAILNWHLNQS